METKELKINIPEGYEIDEEKSTFENIVFKKKHAVNCWEDLPKVSGVFIKGVSADISVSNNYETEPIYKNVFLNEKYAKSALALAQISQLLPYYDSKVDWNESKIKYCICRKANTLIIDTWCSTYYPIAFNTRKEAKRFLEHNEQLIKDYYMMEG